MWILPVSTSWRSAPAVEDSTSASSSRFQMLASSAGLNGTLSPAVSWYKRWKRTPWLRRLYGRICEPSTADSGVALWISSLLATRVSRFSQAGSRRGEDDARHLWPEVFRVVQEVRPALVFLENVAGHVGLGLGGVLRDLRSAGYRATATLVRAADVGAPHQRERVFILGVADGERTVRWPMRERDSEATAGSTNADGTVEDAPWADQPRLLGRRGRVRETDGALGNTRGDGDGRHLSTEARSLTEHTPSREPTPPDSPLGDSHQPSTDARATRRGSRRAVGEPSGSVDDTAGSRRERRRSEPGEAVRDEARRGESSRRCDDMADTRGSQQPRRKPEQPAGKRSAGNGKELADLFPPGPSDLDAWRRILERWPELAPALEPPFRELADGVAADRRQWLRLLGNGVVPLQAAYAFCALAIGLGLTE